MNYVEAQMFKVAPFPLTPDSDQRFVMQIQSSHGKTNWLAVSPETLKGIEELLLQQENYKE